MTEQNNIGSITTYENKIKGNLHCNSVEFWQKTASELKDLLNEAITSRKEEIANLYWYLHEISEIYYNYATAMQDIGLQQYYSSWCALEKIEIAAGIVLKNPFFDSKVFGIPALCKIISNWQELFPYAVFMSPELAIGRHECSICGTAVDPWQSCEHKIGRVYGGVPCYLVARDVKFHGLAFVANPVQKYSVPFLTDEHGGKLDHYDYSVVQFVFDRIHSPFDEWDVEKTTAYHPHKMFPNIRLEDGCPCGSGKTYEGCCKNRPGVIRPHILITFTKAPPNNLPNAAFAGYGEHSAPALMKACTCNEDEE